MTPSIQIKLKQLNTSEEIVREVQRISLEYWSDILDYKFFRKISPIEFFEFIKKLPRIQETSPVEIIARPKFITSWIFRKEKTYFDSISRTILTISYFMLRNNVFNEKNVIKIIVSGSKNFPTHIYCEINNMPFDPFCEFSSIGESTFIEKFRKEYPLE
jgi:hypothetical protein